MFRQYNDTFRASPNTPFCISHLCGTRAMFCIQHYSIGTYLDWKSRVINMNMSLSFAVKLFRSLSLKENTYPAKITVDIYDLWELEQHFLRMSACFNNFIHLREHSLQKHHQSKSFFLMIAHSLKAHMIYRHHALSSKTCPCFDFSSRIVRRI